MERSEESSTATATIHNLVQLSKKLADANRSKQKYELQLVQLTFFANFTEMIRENEREVLESLFTFTTQVVPDPESLNSGENIFLTVENGTSDFTFDSLFWYLTVSFNKGVDVTIWSLESPLTPGKRESFYTKFIHTPDFSPVQIDISLTFATSFNENNFIRVFRLTTILIDILHLLSPSRRLTFRNASLGPPYILRLDASLSEENKSLPPILRFDLKCNEALKKMFPSLLLPDSAHRGFPASFHEFISSEEFSVYADEERVLVCKESDVISIRTYSAKLLFAVKLALIRRLLKHDELRISCPTDADCDKLYRLKLLLESANDANNEAFQFGDFQEIYLSLRQVSEGLQFSTTSSAAPEEYVAIQIDPNPDPEPEPDPQPVNPLTPKPVPPTHITAEDLKDLLLELNSESEGEEEDSDTE
jgi:hypothetical protein